MRDAIGRKWQLSTIQADFNMPERFDINYVGPDNEKHRAVMIHRALFGSVERFFGVVLEHFAGAFPAWLAPVQVRVLPVRDDHDTYARRLVDRLDAEGFRADMVEADEPLGGRIRKAKMREAAVRAGGRRRRRRALHGRESTREVVRSSAACRWTSSSTVWPATSSGTSDRRGRRSLRWTTSGRGGATAYITAVSEPEDASLEPDHTGSLFERILRRPDEEAFVVHRGSRPARCC